VDSLSPYSLDKVSKIGTKDGPLIPGMEIEMEGESPQKGKKAARLGKCSDQIYVLKRNAQTAAQILIAKL